MILLENWCACVGIVTPVSTKQTLRLHISASKVMVSIESTCPYSVSCIVSCMLFHSLVGFANVQPPTTDNHDRKSSPTTTEQCPLAVLGPSATIWKLVYFCLQFCRCTSYRIWSSSSGDYLALLKLLVQPVHQLAARSHGIRHHSLARSLA